jgi:hypothetical protein
VALPGDVKEDREKDREGSIPPRIVATHGEAPEQYPDPDDDEDAPTYGVNLATGVKIKLGK